MLKEILLSGFTASLPGFVVLYFLALIGREGAGFLSLFFLFYLNSFFPCCFTAYRSLKKLRKTRAFRPLKEFSESVAKGACLSTLASAAVSGVLYVIYQLVVADFTLAGLFGSAFLGALCPVFYLLIFNMLGGHIVFRIQRVLEKNNTETHWGWNTDYFPPPAETPSSH